MNWRKQYNFKECDLVLDHMPKKNNKKELKIQVGKILLIEILF